MDKILLLLLADMHLLEKVNMDNIIYSFVQFNLQLNYFLYAFNTQKLDKNE